jgi:hypothetical protein
MRTTIASVTFLLLGAGAVTIGARSNIAHMRGSDTMFDLTQGLLKGIPAHTTAPVLPAVAACANTSGLNYEGSGSGNGATDMRAGLQELAPMSSPLSGGNVCGPFTDAKMPQKGEAAEGMVLALDAVNIAANDSTGGAAACGGIAFSTAGGAGLTLNLATDGACNEQGCNGQTYNPVDERDYLRVLYFGIHGGNATTTRNCASNVRKKLISSYKNLFQTQSCSTGACNTKPLRHAYRRDDASGTTDVFFAAIGVDSRFNGYNKKSNRGGGLQQSNPFCNAGDVGPDHTVKGVNLGFDDSLTPVAGPNWDTKVGDSDFADLDPIRSACADGGDDVCSANNMRRCQGGSLPNFTCRSNADCIGGGTCSSAAPGYISTLQCVANGKVTGQFCNDDSDCTTGVCSGTNGLVQVIFVPSQQNADLNYPVDLCDQGLTDVFDSNLPYLSFFGRCGDGSDAFGNGCPIQGKTCSPSTPCKVPGSSTPKTSGVSYLCMQQSFLGQQAICFAGSPSNGTECRGNNNWMRDINGTLLTDSSVDPANPRQFLGAFFRRHTVFSGEGGTCTCKENDATAQIGCIVGCGEACSIGYGGGGAIKPVGKATAVAVRGTLPNKTTVQALLSTDPNAFFNRYRLSRKLFYNTVVGYGEPTFDVSADTTGAGVSGEELNLVKCAVNPNLQQYYEAVYGFFGLPNNAPFCQDFAEFKTCTGGLHPGDPCTVNGDCTGAGLVTDGTCSANPTCGAAGATATSNTNACANNGSVGLPL